MSFNISTDHSLSDSLTDGEKALHNMLKKKRKQIQQGTSNVTMRRVDETIVAVQKQEVLHVSVRECAPACVGSCVCVRMNVSARARAYVCARVRLLIQHATRRHIDICGLSGSTTFFEIMS
jgi:hypothetical protein